MAKQDAADADLFVPRLRRSGSPAETSGRSRNSGFFEDPAGRFRTAAGFFCGFPLAFFASASDSSGFVGTASRKACKDSATVCEPAAAARRVGKASCKMSAGAVTCVETSSSPFVNANGARTGGLLSCRPFLLSRTEKICTSPQDDAAASARSR